MKCRLKVARVAHVRVPTFDPETGKESGSRIVREEVLLERVLGAGGWTSPEHLAFTTEDPAAFEQLTEGAELTLDIS